MPSTVLVGAQWGDEGKGKITDLIASEYDYVVRYQGGNNAGHTVIHGDKKLALHLMPSGVMYENAIPVIGAWWWIRRAGQGNGHARGRGHLLQEPQDQLRRAMSSAVPQGS